MKNKLNIAVVLLLLVHVSLAQKNTPVVKLPEKGAVQQNSKSGKDAATAVQSDSPTVKTFDVAEGKKGLNAVNVRNAKQAESSANGQGTNPPVSGSTGNVQENKHAINTKGTGATRDK